MNRLGLVAAQLLLLANLCHGAAMRVGEFQGTHQESWESFPAINSTRPTLGRESYLQGSVAVFGGAAKLIRSRSGVYTQPGGQLYSSGTGLGSSGRNAKVVDGSQGLVLLAAGPGSADPATLRFDSPLVAFGGYWGISTFQDDPRLVSFQFFDANNNLVASDSLSYNRSAELDPVWGTPGDGKLVWAGWKFDTPVTRIVFGGGGVVNDALQAIVIPEPAAWVLALVALAAFAVRAVR